MGRFGTRLAPAVHEIVPADRLIFEACESGIHRFDRLNPGESDPQALGEERLIRPIPVIRLHYYSYYLE
jgi:hypothetical protein